jgi:hypothetical protein
MLDRQGVGVTSRASAGKPAEQESNLTEMGFTPEETTRLILVRQRLQRGELNEWEINYRRLRFACWLYEQGYISC